MLRPDVHSHSTASSADRPEWLERRLRWFRELQFGIILHWGPYSLWDCCESWPLVPDDEWARNDSLKCWNERDRDLDRFQRDYWDLNRQFNPTLFDPGAWAAAFAESGAKYVCFTTKHHDGFCMWDTATTDYKITGLDCPMHSHPKADVTKHLFDALRRHGLAVSAYFSKADWHCPYYWAPEPKPRTRKANTLSDPEVWERFVRYTREQLRELLTDYGRIDILWLDAGWVRDDEDIRMAEIVDMARMLQPEILIANRTVGDYEDFVTPEGEIPEGGLPQTWESCIPVAGWKYTEGEKLKSVEEVLSERQKIRDLGGNFLLGIGPKPDGTLSDEVLAVLRGLGR